MFNAIGTVLAWLYDATHNYGLAIMLLTLAIMVVLTPLTLKGTRSMIAMQRLQPEMKKIQNRYKDDRQKLNEEMMKFYKENSINPVGGCLPLVLQMPVFFVLYRVLYGLTNPAGYGQDMGRAFGKAATDPQAVFANFGAFHPNHLSKSSKMYADLSRAREMKSFGLDLATSASHALSTNFVKALPFLVLIALIALTAWYQQKQIQGRNPAAQQQINPQQQMLMKIMPYFLPLISFTLPAGVILYFVVSNVYRIGQQGFITRTMYTDEKGRLIPPAVIDTTSAEGGGAPKGFMAQLRESMAESGPRIGKNADGANKGQGRANLAKGAKGAKPAAKASPKTGSGAGSRSGAKPAAKATKGSGKATASPKPTGTRGAPAAKGGANGAAGGRPPTKGGPAKGGPAKSPASQEAPATAGPAPADKGGAGGVDPTAPRPSRAAPSRTAPTPDPNRTKKKRS